MLEKQPGLLVKELTTMTQNLDPSKQQGETNQDNTQQISKPRTTAQQCKFIQSRSAFQLRFRLLYKEWYFYSHRSHAGWDLVFRVFNLIPKIVLSYLALKAIMMNYFGKISE
jgi:hypothetical protein